MKLFAFERAKQEKLLSVIDKSPVIFFFLFLLTPLYVMGSEEYAVPRNTCTLKSDTSVSREGYFSLSWQCEGNHENTALVLRESPNIQNKITIVRLNAYPHTTLAVSGKVNGHYAYTLEQANGTQNAVSNSVTVEVKHHSLALALTYFFSGAVLFLVLVFLILYQNNKINKADVHAST